jgi:hypothetical protein
MDLAARSRSGEDWREASIRSASTSDSEYGGAIPRDFSVFGGRCHGARRVSRGPILRRIDRAVCCDFAASAVVQKTSTVSG